MVRKEPRIDEKRTNAKQCIFRSGERVHQKMPLDIDRRQNSQEQVSEGFQSLSTTFLTGQKSRTF